VQNMGIIPEESWWQHLVTNAGMVAVVNSVLAGVFAGMLTRFASSLHVYYAAAAGLAVFAASVVAHQRYQLKRYTEFEGRLKTLFPSE
jgi:predicted benzoate:H+ symporter BenE